ncbi:GNAT family N-acetyltransferase [Rhodovulum sp. DZ06]|uniref:GNAT family N-acetyltransferase n=1 Tax=Rhodovulum sp. DZ06 TaxID=3425126 RepID=UPI003D343C00
MHTIRTARPEDAPRCHQIEAAAYSPDEAATLAKIETRIALNPGGFVVLEVDGEIAGFINSGCAHVVDMADDAFKSLVGHDPEAPKVVILSVVLDPAHHGKGLARPLMEAFVARMRALRKKEIHLMCKTHYVPLYEALGYGYDRPSASSYGGARWHEMSMTL